MLASRVSSTRSVPEPPLRLSMPEPPVSVSLRSTEDGVVAGRPVEGVVAAAAVERVGAGVPRERVVATSAGGVLDGGAGKDRQRVEAGANHLGNIRVEVEGKERAAVVVDE